MPYNWFYQKRLLATKIGRYFHIEKKEEKKKQGVSNKDLKKIYYERCFA